MSFNYFMVRDLFKEIENTNKSIKLEYEAGQYYLIESDFKIEKHPFSDHYLVVEGYEYVITEKKSTYSIVDLREVRSIHIIDIKHDLNNMRERINKIWSFADYDQED